MMPTTETLDITSAANYDLMAFVNNGLRLERPETSALHRLVETHPRGAFVSQFMDGGRCVIGKVNQGYVWGGEHVFLVEHDWSTALQATKEESVDFRPPFGEQVFEFKVSGKRICAKVQIETTGNVISICFIELASAWVMLPLYDLNSGIIPDSPPSFLDLQWSNRYLSPIYDLVIGQIRGACIALDTQIAKIEDVCASPQLKKSRAASGKVVPYDFHILTIRGRSNRDKLDSSTPSGARVRLHFRRGHYRHFHDDSKIWINWTLVGDPDLGFIDKHYRLRS